MRIKICGITTLEDARFCAAAGADYLGFIQHRASPRYIEPGEARDIVDWIHGPDAVGVFVDAAPDEVNRLADRAGFTWVQLHGDESPDDCAAIERPVIKAIGVRAGMSPDDIAGRMQRFDGAAEYVLLDTRTDALHGGTGSTFDWSLAAGRPVHPEAFLAGGLHPGNVADAVRTVRPFGVDVSSGVESAPGRKDFERVEALFEALAPFIHPRYEDGP